MHNGRKGSPGFANWQIAPLLCPHLGDGHSIIEFAMFIDRSAQTMQVHPRLVLDLIGNGSCCRVVLVISFIKSCWLSKSLVVISRKSRCRSASASQIAAPPPVSQLRFPSPQACRYRSRASPEYLCAPSLFAQRVPLGTKLPTGSHGYNS